MTRRASFASRILLAIVLPMFALSLAIPAHALDKIRFAKVVPHPFAFIIAEVGVEQGIFKKHGIELDIFATGGSAKLHQALAADSADIGIGSGPGIGFVARGAPEIAIAATHGAPLNLGIVVTSNSPLYPKDKTVKDLKGIKIGVSTSSSLTYFLSGKLAAESGWGPDGMTRVPLGRLPANLAAAKAGNIQAFVMSVDVGLALEAKGTGRVFLAFGDYIKHFHTHILYATTKYLKAHPDAVKRFLAAWFETVKFVKAHKDVMVKTAAKHLKMSEAVANKAYDMESPAFSLDGRFNDKALDVIGEGLVVTKILDKKPDMKKLYTEAYLPK
jgi:NitT/TauT family transport system substrate-binding protein